MFGDLTRVGSNFHAMQSWSNLKQVNGKIGQIQSRLSTGKRINSAEDDTSGYALSKHLESRVRGMSQALDNVGTAKNVLNIAEGGSTEGSIDINGETTYQVKINNYVHPHQWILSCHQTDKKIM